MQINRGFVEVFSLLTSPIVSIAVFGIMIQTDPANFTIATAFTILTLVNML
jgi:hypothetical protein